MWVRYQMFACGCCMQDVHVFATEGAAKSDARANRRYASLRNEYRWAFLPKGEQFETVRQLLANTCDPPDQDEVDKAVSAVAFIPPRDIVEIGTDLDAMAKGGA
jgi:hypothetical protein